MADQKITQLTEDTSPISTDILPMVKDPGGTPITEKVTIANLMASNKALGTDIAVGTDDAKFATSLALANAGFLTGWIPISATLTYSSVDGHTFVVSTSSDLTGIIGVVDRIKFTNNSTTFYGIVTAISSSTITLYGGQNYSVANSAITNPFYSHMKVPFGFNPDPTIWRERFADTSERIQGSPSVGVWYNIGSSLLAIPIGIWYVTYQVSIVFQKTTTTTFDALTTLSTANNSETDKDWSGRYYVESASASQVMSMPIYKTKTLSLASKTTYYLNIMTEVASQGNLAYEGQYSTTIIEAICAYL